MSITDELRKCVKTGCQNVSGNGRCSGMKKILAIADRIDAEHERKAAEVASGWDYWESTHVKVPKDADGETIHVGDVMAGEIIGGGLGEPFEVIGYIMSDGELEPMDEDKCPRKRKYLHHYHELTVEDVLREFAQKMNENIGMYVGEAIDADEWRDADNKTIAEYAAKLQLKED